MDDVASTEGALFLVMKFLPAWLSCLVLSGLFAEVWRRPTLIGWNHVGDLRAVVLLEIVGVVTLTYFLTGRDEFLGWIPVLPAALVLGFGLWVMVSPLVGVVLPLHLLIRAFSVWKDRRQGREVFNSLELSLILIIGFWFLVGLVPIPHLGWTEAATPKSLWWSVVGWGGWMRIPQALPAWGFLYFMATAAVEAFGFRWPGIITYMDRLTDDEVGEA